MPYVARDGKRSIWVVAAYAEGHHAVDLPLTPPEDRNITMPSDCAKSDSAVPDTVR